MKIMCVYKITNTKNNQIYVGSTSTGFEWRKKLHLRTLRKKTHHNRHLQSAFDKYGETFFDFSILEVVTDSSLLTVKEQEWVDRLNPEYNTLKKNILSHIGVKRSDETKRKISKSLTGKPLTQSHKDSIRKTLTGKKQSKELIEKRIKHQLKPVLQLTKDGVLIKKWNSPTEVETELGWNRKNIYRVLWGLRQTYKKCVWKYVDII